MAVGLVVHSIDNPVGRSQLVCLSVRTQKNVRVCVTKHNVTPQCRMRYAPQCSTGCRRVTTPYWRRLINYLYCNEKLLSVQSDKPRAAKRFFCGGSLFVAQ